MLNIPTNKLKAALNCVAVKDIRAALKNVLIECTDSGDLYIVGADGAVLFAGLIRKENIDWTDVPQLGPWRILVPTDVVKAAVKTKKLIVTLSAMPDGRYVLEDQVFTAEDIVFPDWRRVVPQSLGEEKPAQYDPELIDRVYKAMSDWHYGLRTCYLYQRGNAAGVLRGVDSTARGIIMPLRTELSDVVGSFSVDAYEIEA